MPGFEHVPYLTNSSMMDIDFLHPRLLVICGAIYALGHLGPLIVQSSIGQNEFVAFFGQLIALILPVLDHFNIQAAVAGGVKVPIDYLLGAALYCVLYSAVAMLLALILFEDRDLA